tara:strand:- start:125 stop:328 length:204 start_codon:yes stop_codon:yes gene_type:complete
MDKIKLANGIMYISVALLFVFTAALSLSKGFSSDNNVFLVGGAICIVGIFYFGYKGMSTVLDAFFKK